jgi:DNA-binding NtrC family response regulator
MAIEDAGEYSEMTGEKLPTPVVLVVDDEPLIRWSLSEGLTDMGYVVKQAATGAEARNVLAATQDDPLVVVLDLRLPDVSDLSLLREIRTRRPDVPVLMMTAHGTSDDARQATCLGVFKFLTKPFDVRALVDLVGEAWAAAH